MNLTEIRSPDEEYVDRGIDLFLAGELDESSRWFGNAVLSNPYNFKAHLYQGHTLLQKNQPVEALIEYRKAAKIKPGEALPLFYQALAYYKRFKYENAYNLLIAIDHQELVEDAAVESKVLNCRLIKDVSAELLSGCEANVRADSTFITRTLRKTQEYIDFKWYSKAFSTIDVLKRIAPANPHIYYYRGFIFFKKRKDAEAECEFRKSIELGPDLKESQRSLGVLYARRGRLDQARQIFRDLLKKYPDDRITRCYLEEIAEQTG